MSRRAWPAENSSTGTTDDPPHAAPARLSKPCGDRRLGKFEKRRLDAPVGRGQLGHQPRPVARNSSIPRRSREPWPTSSRPRVGSIAVAGTMAMAVMDGGNRLAQIDRLAIRL